MNIPASLTDNDVISQLKNEENTKRKYITPVLEKCWHDDKKDKIIMEYYFTDGRISIDEYNIAHRGKPKKVDYLMLYYNNVPLALVEAKGADHTAGEGYQQAKDYAIMLDVPFAYATNGDDLLEADLISGLNRTMKMTDFPDIEVLWQRFLTEKKFTSDIEALYKYPYYTTRTGKRPRYYQRIAINRTVEAIARGQKRILLVMATGTGKTFTSFQIIYRFWKTQQNPRILFIVDRNILVDQTMQKDFAPFMNSMVKVDNQNIDTAHEIYLALYQQLKTDKADYYKQFPRDFFDLIVIDECHRGSADIYSSWHEILSWFDSAIQIGMTATPRNDEELNANNLAYFGNPVYTYSLKQGIEDGFLAPYKVLAVTLDVDEDGYFPPEDAVDENGIRIERRLYEAREFDRNIIIPARRELVAKRITDFMKTNNARYEKTIVFCETIEHCQEMVRLLENENADLVSENPRYIMQITGDNEIGKAQLDNFIDPSSRYPVIAVTSKLMSTGVDAETCKIIVLDRTIGSMTEFKQIIGRGTRVKEHYEVDGVEETKMYFTIIDFRKNYLKFNDPEFDGYPIDIINVTEKGKFPKPPIRPKSPPQVPVQNRRVARVRGIDVNIIGEHVEYLDADGNLIQEDLTSCIRNNVLIQFPQPEDFQKAWLLNSDKKHFAFNLLLETTEWKDNYEIRYGYKIDDFDIILDIAYGVNPPKSKERRVNSSAVYTYIHTFTPKAQDILWLLLDAYVAQDFESLKDLDIFNLPQFTQIGYTKLSAVKLFSGKNNYYNILGELENKLYEGELE